MEYIVKINDNDLVDSNGIKRIEKMIKLIRCKDCIHHRKDTCSAGAGIAFPPPDDWFCADGEPKD